MVSKHFSFGELFVLDERDSSFWLNECKPQVIFTSMEGSTLQQRSSFESKNLLDSTPPPPRVSAKHLSFHFISLHFISLHFISFHFTSVVPQSMCIQRKDRIYKGLENGLPATFLVSSRIQGLHENRNMSDDLICTLLSSPVLIGEW